MFANDFINPEEITINGKEFLISSIPAMPAKQIYGEMVRATQDVGDIGLTFLPSATVSKLLSYAATKKDEGWRVFNGESERNDITVFPDLETEIKLESAIIRKNFGFFFNGSLRGILAELRGKKSQVI